MNEKKNFVLGFTGAQQGMTTFQKEKVRKYLKNVILCSAAMESAPPVALHGDCIGADEDFNEICAELDIPRYCRPCTITYKRAFTDAFQVAEPIAPLDRNRIIAEKCDLLIACPKEEREQLRSGTWTTVRATRRLNKTVLLITPSLPSSAIHTEEPQ